MEIGKLVMANIGKPSKEIMEAVIKKYGFADVKKEQAAAKEAQTEGACANPKNAALVLALKECGKYYFQEGNHNAGITYTKAVDALLKLEEEVTEDNAMSFGKGKTKLPGIGKGTAQKMLEFTQSGTFEKLEEKRAAHAWECIRMPTDLILFRPCILISSIQLHWLRFDLMNYFIC